MARASINGLLISTCPAIALLILLSAADFAGGGGSEIQLSLKFPAAKSICEGKELGMESEMSRRILEENQRYISYGALLKDYIPCSQRGCSYYYCRPGPSVNPYRRGCSRIARCRG